MFGPAGARVIIPQIFTKEAPHMPSTLTSLNVHAVFSTKERRPLIKREFKEDLFSYLGGIARDLKAVPMAIGGIEDHVHLLLGIRAWHRLDYAFVISNRDPQNG